MGLSDQQHLYVLPNYFLVFDDNNIIVGLLTQEQMNGNTVTKLESEGYHTELVNFDALNMQGTRLLQKLGITKNRWLTAGEYMEQLKQYEEEEQK